MEPFSIVTIIKGRRKQLRNLLESIGGSTFMPHDIQVVCMDDPDDIVVPKNVNVTVHALDSGDALPLAAARNKGISFAQTGNVILVDVDCIVSPTLFSSLLSALKSDTIVAAFPLYLPMLPDSGTYATLVDKGIPHPARKDLPVDTPVNHLNFWSLVFAVQKQSFALTGGFDESFTGYGAEDTDFAMSFHKAGLQQVFVKDYVLHQYHDKYDPPLNHFREIVENAVRYKKKWHEWPMRSWLRAFEGKDLITMRDNDISIIRDPTDSEIEQSVSKNPY